MKVTPGAWLRDVKVEYKAAGAGHHGIVQVYFPKKYRPDREARTLIVLHGYRQRPGDWEKTPIAKYADIYNFVVVCPAMTTTLYESKYFPETVNRWAPIPGSEFISRVLLPFVRKEFGLAKDRSRTGIFGISTGARGAVLLAVRDVKSYGAAAGLSGDYDSVSMRNDRILTSVYGPYDRFRDRWEEEVNLITMAKKLKRTPLFLGHGTTDGVVPPRQTELLIGRLNELGGTGAGYKLVVDREKSMGAGHDWKYWGSLVPDVLKFFDRELGK